MRLIFRVLLPVIMIIFDIVVGEYFHIIIWMCLLLMFSIVNEHEVIKLEPQNRMLRFGFGKHNNEWFIRADFWWIGLRIKKGPYF